MKEVIFDALAHCLGMDAFEAYTDVLGYDKEQALEALHRSEYFRQRPDPFVERRPPAPTNARPGSPEKLRVMIERMERGVGLFSPRDPRNDPRRD